MYITWFCKMSLNSELLIFHSCKPLWSYFQTHIQPAAHRFGFTDALKKTNKQRKAVSTKRFHLRLFFLFFFSRCVATFESLKSSKNKQPHFTSIYMFYSWQNIHALITGAAAVLLSLTPLFLHYPREIYKLQLCTLAVHEEIDIPNLPQPCL